MRHFPMPLASRALLSGLGQTWVVRGTRYLTTTSPRPGLWEIFAKQDDDSKKKDEKKKRGRKSKKKQENHHLLSVPTTVPEPGHLILSQPRILDVRKGPSDDQVTLSEEQQTLVDLILTGRNVFYSGAAGTGKSSVLRAVVERLRRLGRRVEVVAPTGRAALAINGMTTWSYAGWSPSAHARPLAVLRKWALSGRTARRLADTDVLIIDEVSMVENHHLERLSEIMKEARGHQGWPLGWGHVQKIRDSAFGGCQIIATGDFFQLPPVLPFQNCIQCGVPLLKEVQPGNTTHRCPFHHGNWPDSYKWAFQSEVWEEADFAHVELKQVHRQAGDPLFIEILNRFRSGTVTYDDIMVLADPNRETQDLTNATRLYPTRTEVAKYNDDRLRELKTPPFDFGSRDSFHWNEKAHPDLERYGERRADGRLAALREHRFEPFLRLKVGMPVVLLSNIDVSGGLVNGSQGVVVDFSPVDREDLRIRTRRLLGLSNYVATLVDDELFYYATSPMAERMVLPVVKFDNGVTETIYPECSTHEMGNETLPAETDGEDGDKRPKRPRPSVLCRTQIPLVAGWAMSIHKAQGMTLGKVIIDVTRAFAEGQVYVALSRVKSLSGLKIEGDPRGLLVGRNGNRDVREFYEDKFGDQASATPGLVLSTRDN